MQNLHRHSCYSNIFTSDSAVTNEDYAKRAAELGHKVLSSVEHGYQGYYFQTYELAKKYNLKKVDNVIVTKSEMEIIQSVKGKSRQKVLFTLLVLAKYYNAVSDKNKNWTNLEYKKIFKLANVQLSIQNQALLINDLYNCGFVNVSKNVGKPNIQVNFVDNESDTVLTITRLKDLGKEYLMFCGEDYIRCQKCGVPIKKSRNGKVKYCGKCAKMIDREKAKIRMGNIRK